MSHHLDSPLARPGRIGVWAVATLATDAGGWRSTNRIGLPIIHPLFTQFNEDLGNRAYAVGTPAVFGFAEWNGRSPTDNAPNVMFSLAANTPVSLGIGKESVTSKPSAQLPYVPAAAPTGRQPTADPAWRGPA